MEVNYLSIRARYGYIDGLKDWKKRSGKMRCCKILAGSPASIVRRRESIARTISDSLLIILILRFLKQLLLFALALPWRTKRAW